MKNIEPPDSHYFMAAVGWLELGNPRESLAELSHLQPGLHDHPKVLELKWQIMAALKNWDEALVLARQLIQIKPDEPTGYIHQAYALRRVADGGLPKAWDSLVLAAKQFPTESIIAYNLACYAAQMGRLEEAWQWYCRASEIGNALKIKKMALADSDLEPIWERINNPPTVE